MDKRVNEVRLRGKIELLRQEIVKWEPTRLRAARLEAQIEQREKKNQHLKKVVEDLREKIRDSRKQCAKTDVANDNRRKGNERWRDSMLPSSEVLNTTKTKASLSRNELRDYCARLRRCRRGLMADLFHSVLPLKYLGDHTISGSGALDVMIEVVGSNVLEVEEAHPRVPIYSIAGLLLPDADNLLHFKATEVQCPSVVLRASCSVQHSSAGSLRRCHVLDLSAALANLTLLVNVLAGLSQLHLPHHLSHAEFTDPNLGDEALGCRVAKLNLNIVYFCLAAGIPEKKISRPSRTIKNIKLLLGHLPIQRDELSVVMTDSFEESLRSACRGVTHATCYRAGAARYYIPYRNTPPHDAPESLLTDYHFVYSEDLCVSSPQFEQFLPQ